MLNAALHLQTLYNAWYTLRVLNLNEAVCSNANSAADNFQSSKNILFISNRRKFYVCLYRIFLDDLSF
jgi:hypothetical protein